MRHLASLNAVRALLVVNPRATTTTARARDVIVKAMRADFHVQVSETAYRAHAVELARRAVQDQFDVVLALGGDGTVNEVVNGLLAEGPHPNLPRFGVLPGGDGNVFARALGIPTSPLDAAGVLIEALHEDSSRVIGLGTVVRESEEDRWFTFAAGLGFDAEVVAEVERRRAKGARSSSFMYVQAAFDRYFRRDHREAPALTLVHPDEPSLFLGIIQNTSPWTFIGNRPVDPCPEASFDTGLDLFALRGMPVSAMLRHVTDLVVVGRPPHGKDVLVLHDQDTLTFHAENPIDLQVDGDHLGRVNEAEFRAVPRALRVVI